MLTRLSWTAVDQQATRLERKEADEHRMNERAARVREHATALTTD
jgi:hypothetical protein